MKDTYITQPQFAMIWFGAALSIAEIMTGTYLAPLGLTQGLYAIILGHIIGGVLLFGASLIGGRLRQGSMNTTAFSFGPLGAKVFAFLNMLQLIGWTSIMIYDAMLALQELAPLSPYDLDDSYRSACHLVAFHRSLQYGLYSSYRICFITWTHHLHGRSHVISMA